MAQEPCIFRAIVSPAARVDAWDPPAEGFFDVPAARAEGRSLEDVLGPAARPLAKAIARAARTGRRQEVRLALPLGSVLAWAVPLTRDRVLLVGRHASPRPAPVLSDAEGAVEEARAVAEALVGHLREDERSEARAVVDLATSLDLRLALLDAKPDAWERARLDEDIAALLDQLQAAVEALRRDAVAASA